MHPQLSYSKVKSFNHLDIYILDIIVECSTKSHSLSDMITTNLLENHFIHTLQNLIKSSINR